MVRALTWESLSTPWQVCLEETWNACRAGAVPVGAVVATTDGEILARGRNRIPERSAPDGLVRGNPLAHAELNALITVDYSAHDPHTLHLYTSLEPCPLCMGAFYMSGLRSLHYAARDPYAGSLNLLGTTPYLSRKPIRIFALPSEALETVLILLHTAHITHKYGADNSLLLGFLAVWEEILPAGVRLGRLFYQGGEYQRLCSADGSAAQMLAWLVDFAASQS